MSITEHTVKTKRHTSFYLADGPEDGPVIVFVHGWPELSISWRHQLPVLANLGFRAIAPDMRGYGRSTVYSQHSDYSQQQIVDDMIDFIDSLGHEKAVWQDARFQQHLLGGIRWALGLARGSTTPLPAPPASATAR